MVLTKTPKEQRFDDYLGLFTAKFMVRVIAVITLLLVLHIPVEAEIIILKSGKVFEGEIIKENSDEIKLKSDFGVLTFTKSSIKLIAKDVEELLKPADELWAEAKACYERALELREEPEAKNKELGKGENLLYEARQVYDEIQQMFPQGKYAWIEHKIKEILDLMREFRCARVKVIEKEEPETREEESLIEESEPIAPGSSQILTSAEKGEIASLDSKAYIKALCAAIPAMIEDSYGDALIAVETKLPPAQLSILEKQLTSNNAILKVLKEKIADYMGEQLPIPIISGLYFDNIFLGLKNGQFALESSGQALFFPVALFNPEKIFAIVGDSAQDHLARGWFCMQNLWFAQASQEFEAEKASGGHYADFFIKLIDEHAGELAETCLPIFEKPISNLYNKNKLFVAFMYQESLELLLQYFGTKKLLDETSKLTILILDSVVKETSSAASQNKDNKHLNAAYIAEITRFAYECMLKRKDDIALLALEKALSIEGDNPYALTLKKRIESCKKAIKRNPDDASAVGEYQKLTGEDYTPGQKPDKIFGPKNLIAYWRFDKIAGNMVKDSSGNENHVTVHGAKLVAGKVGRALSFDGINDYVEGPVMQERSVIMWVKPAGREKMVLYDGGIIGRADQAYYTGIYPPGAWANGQAFDTTYGLWLSFWYSDVVISYDELKSGWHHIAISWDGNVTVRIGIDGKFPKGYILNYTSWSAKQSQPFILTEKPRPDATVTTLIGKSRNPKWQVHFKGLIDEVKIYDRALSAEEIKADYKKVK